MILQRPEVLCSFEPEIFFFQYLLYFQEGKTATDVADVATKPVLTGEYKKEDLLEASRSGNEEKLMSLLTPLNVNCHASDGRKSTPLHLAAGYNRTRIGRCWSGFF